MYHAARRGDPKRKLIPIADWLVKHRADVAYCPVCGHDLGISGARSTTVTTHFSHIRFANCPLSATSGRAFDRFRDAERVDESTARAAREYALEHVESIYERARSLCPGLSWKEFLPLLTKASEYRVWSLKGLNLGYLPYLLLCCADAFDVNKPAGRSRRIFFVLEPGAADAEFWHLPPTEKQVVWRVSAGHPLEVVPILMKIGEVEPWYRMDARRRLKL